MRREMFRTGYSQDQHFRLFFWATDLTTSSQKLGNQMTVKLTPEYAGCSRSNVVIAMLLDFQRLDVAASGSLPLLRTGVASTKSH